MKKENEVLGYQLEKSRELTKMYLSALKEVDVHKNFEINGDLFNSVYWEVAHMAVTQNFLVNYLIYGDTVNIEWGKLFGMGSGKDVTEAHPSYAEVWKTFNEVGNLAIKQINELSVEDLDKPTKKEFNVAGIKTVRDTIVHAIRHEGIHAGQISWLCKMHGIKTL